METRIKFEKQGCFSISRRHFCYKIQISHSRNTITRKTKLTGCVIAFCSCVARTTKFCDNSHSVIPYDVMKTFRRNISRLARILSSCPICICIYPLVFTIFRLMTFPFNAFLTLRSFLVCHNRLQRI
jgi:hypothetical protein